MTIPLDYAERVYAGVLGKLIGVYLGRPFEGWTYEKIMAELGEIRYYVNDRLQKPLVVTDDDISGTFTFIRALADHPGGEAITSEQIGKTWLNYIIENQSILWWGGLGNSTEHTAYLRLKQGIPAPESGSIALNGKVVAEQIGAQIFIDGWGLVCPGDPEKAAALAAKAARVSHDGEAVIAAQVIAAMEAQAFIDPDLNLLLDTACHLIPSDSTIYAVIDDLREWRAKYSDWREARQRIAEQYGYAQFPGNVHVVPNHALVQLGLLYGDDNFQKALMVTNTSGWDTDCNSGNVGCIMGIRGGLESINHGPDWRGPVADRMYLPTADGGRGIYDAVQQTFFLVNLGRRLAGQPPVHPKQGARFHFELNGAVQGFEAEECPETKGILSLRNTEGYYMLSTRSLALDYHHLAPGLFARASTATFIPPEAIDMPHYTLSVCPTLVPGQTVRAHLSADEGNFGTVCGRLYLMAYDANDRFVRQYGPEANFQPGQTQLLEWTLEDPLLTPIAKIGVEIHADQFAEGTLYLDYLTWDGEPNVRLSCPEGSGTLWKRSWIHAVDTFRSYPAKPGRFGISQNHGRGLLIYGSRDWQDYQAGASLRLHLLKAGGIAARVQGLQRYYALLLRAPDEACLVKVYDGVETVLAQAAFGWTIEQDVELDLQVRGNRLRGWVDGQALFDVIDQEMPLRDGAMALVCEEGYFSTGQVEIAPVQMR
jgi:ADP-ribosylglycohydrolase